MFVVLAAIVPIMAWLGPLGFAILLALAGLLCAPAIRIREADRPIAVVLLALLGWAALSSLWSPFHPTKAANSVALKAALQLVLYWSAWQGAQAADRRLAALALRVLAFGLAAYGALLVVEAYTSGGVYEAVRDALHMHMRPDLARKNVAHGSFVLALLWPVAATAGKRAGAPLWLAAPMALGAADLAYIFLSDAPVLAVGLALLAGGAVWAAPRLGPRVLAVGAAAGILLMPLPMLLIKQSDLAAHMPLSYAERLGYWDYAADRIAEKPWWGWGLDASRTFSPHIQLHPHNGALQVWLELGAVGAGLAALVWIIAFRRLADERRNLVAAGAAGSMAIYLFFGAVSFGVWQEWWLALGALIACIAALAPPADATA